MRGFVILVLALLAIVFFGAKKVEATPLSTIVINEVYYDTIGTDSKEEWVELYNTSLFDIDLEGYTLSSNEKSTFIFPAGALIEPGKYFVIAKDSVGFEALYGFDPNLEDMNISFSNGGDFVSLYDDNDTLLDQVVWEGNKYCNRNNINPKAHFGVRTGHSIERKDSNIDTDNSSLDFIDQAIPSPQIGYIQKIYSSDIIINEVVAKPSNGSENEYIELINTGLENIDLFDWILDDIDGGSSPYVILEDLEIIAGGYLVIYKHKSGIALNDSGDEVKLVDPSCQVKNTIIYDKAIKGQSYSKFDDGWKWTSSLTPMEKNVFTAENENSLSLNLPLDVISICSARKIENGEEVKIEGVVTVVPGVLSKSQFYIQKDGCGIQIYSYYKRFPSLEAGDVVEVMGELSEYYNEKRLKTDSVLDIVITSHIDPISPIKASTDDCNEENEGEVIEVEGTVTKTSGSTFWISGSKEIKVYIRKQTGIKKPKMRKGDRVRIVGIVSQYKDTYRLLPFDQDGVIILNSATLPKAGSDLENNLIISIAIFLMTILWKLFLKVKKKPLDLQKKSLVV